MSSVRFAALVAFVLLAACGSPPRAARGGEELSIAYSLETRQPPQRFSLEIPGRGTARVALLRALPNEPQGLAGYFNLALSSDQRAEIERRVAAAHLLDRNDEADLNEGFAGYLRLDRGQRHAELSLGSKDEATRELRRLLDDIVANSAGHPLAALRLEAHARKDEATARVEAKLVHVGVKPLEMAVVPEGDPTATLRVRIVLERGGRLVNELAGSAEDTRRLVERGKLPRGWYRFEPGKSLRLPPLAMPLPMDETDLYARVEVVLRARTAHRAPVDLVLTSPSVSIGEEIRER